MTAKQSDDVNHLQHLWPACFGWYVADPTVAETLATLPTPAGVLVGAKVESLGGFSGCKGVKFPRGSKATVLGCVDAHPKYGPAALVVSWDALVGYGTYPREHFRLAEAL